MAGGGGGAPARVLVVDDDPATLGLVGLALEEAGYRVSRARDGREALARIAEERPALVLTDAMMPIMGGRALVAALRADPATRRLPVILMSAVWEQAAGGGADAALRKPFDLDDLEALVARLLAVGRPAP